MLQVKGLDIQTKQGKMLLNDVSFSLEPGSILGLTGESGAGKSTIIKAIMRLTDKKLKVKGFISLDEKNVYLLSEKDSRALCGTTLGFIPQSPMTAFDPRLYIGKQLRETFMYKLRQTKYEADELAKACLKQVNLRDTDRILNSMPFSLSGGMLQRVAFCFVLGLKPKYILADEPASALDEENKEIVLDLLEDQRERSGILFISHNYNALSKITDKVLVLNKGYSHEYSSFSEVVQNPKHQWTKQFVQMHKGMDKGGFTWKVS